MCYTKFVNQKGFTPLFIVLGIILVIGIACGAYYFGTANNKSQPQILEEIKVVDGSVYKLSSSGKQDIIVKKGEYNGNSVSFTKAAISPDKSKMLLLGFGGASIPFLYYTYLDKINVQHINVAREAVWSHNSRFIAYINGPADALPDAWVYVYDTKLNKAVAIVHDTSSPLKIENLKYDFLTFSNLQWSDDDSGIKVHYVAYTWGEVTPRQIVGEGDTILPVITEK